MGGPWVALGFALEVLGFALHRHCRRITRTGRLSSDSHYCSTGMGVPPVRQTPCESLS